jgi:hypothetical protein
MHRHLMPRAMKPLVMISLLLAAACAVDGPTTPLSGPRAYANQARDTVIPGTTSHFWASGRDPLNCSPKNSSFGSALIGPSGGTLFIGPNRLIIPAGALREKVQISGTVPAGRPFEIDLEPHGLHFQKAAGLILDASSCIDVQDIVYLIDEVTASPPILATYSNLWHTIACPIWHFSGYAIAFFDGSNDGS